MKKIITLVLISCFLTVSAMAQDKEEEKGTPSEPVEKEVTVSDIPWKPIGLTAKIDYVSDYLWRGSYWFQRDGAFFPGINYDLLNLGLIFSFEAEISQDYLFDGKENATVGSRQSLDFGIDYSYTFKKQITLGGGIWYYYMFNNPDISFMTMTIWLRLDSIPFSPGVRYTHDLYYHAEQYQDLYVEIFGSHDFRLTKSLIVDVGLSIGYYYSYFANTNGISDITLTSGLSYRRGGFTLRAGFKYVIVPMKDYWGNNDINRFNANLGLSYSL